MAGDEFPTHKHLGQDELVYIEKGTVHVHLGEQERDLHAGGTVLIPANTWVDIKNAGTERVSVVFVFSAPGFENYMRCDSVLPNEKVTPLSLEGQKECSHQGHVTYKDLDESPKKLNQNKCVCAPSRLARLADPEAFASSAPLKRLSSWLAEPGPESRLA
jgi:hypothetical protein